MNGAGLVLPTARVAGSFRAAIAEYRTAGELDGDSALARSVQLAGSLNDFDRYLEIVRDAPGHLAPGRVPSTTYWWVCGDEFLGRLSIRHRLNDALRRHGGHIGYDVRPSGRRRGHATAMLRAALPIAAGMGIERALLTCDPGNVASRRVIEANGGVPEPCDGPELRYWIPTHPERPNTGPVGVQAAP